MRLIRIMWADCGDATSVQYAGTPAMRSDFAKTGRRMNTLLHYQLNFYLNRLFF